MIFHDTDWIAGVDYGRNDLEIRTGESDKESEPYEPEYLAGVPEDDELDAEEIDPDEIDDILHDEESNPNEYQGQDQEKSEMNEPDYQLEEDTTVDPVEQELHEEQEEPNEGQEYEETAQREVEDSQQPNVRRSTRTTRPVERLDLTMKGKSYLQEERTTQETYEDDVMQLEYCHNLIAQVHPNPIDDIKYATLHAMLIACVMNELSSMITRQGASFAQQQHKGLKVFGKKRHEASAKEINQLYRRNCFSPISVASVTTGERRKAMTALMFLTEKHDSTIKGRMVYNGKPTREWLSRWIRQVLQLRWRV